MVSSSSGRITFGGVASGIDTNSIITQLMAIQKRPIFAIMDRVDSVTSKVSAYGALKSSMSALLTATAPLKDSATFGQRSTTVSAQTADADRVSATATNGAALQNFTFQGVGLATATTAASVQAMGLPIDATVPLNEAGFGAEVTAGTFSINGTTFTIPEATPGTYVSGASIGAAFAPATELDSAGLDIAPVAGSVTINGVSVVFDPALDSLTEVMTRITASAADVTASYDSDTQTMTLTAKENGPAAITIADADGGNFFQSMRMLDGAGANVGVITAGTDLISLDDVISAINVAAIGVTASIVNDSLARPNLLQLTAATDVQVGSGADTSNFLSLTSLLQSPSGTTRTSVKGLGQTQQSSDLDEARLTTALSAASGSFKINGVEVDWDATSDSIQNVITRINASSANVTATYDPFTDRLNLTSDSMGSTSIALEDVAGNFLVSTGLLAATQTLGENASYTINAGALRYATSNTITDAVPGVTITMTDITAAPVTIAVNLAASAVQLAVGAFVTQYNKTVATIRELTKYDPDGANGLLFGDPTLQRLDSQLRSKLTGAQSDMPAGLRSLSDIGLSFGAVGAAVGSTNDLTLDSAKFAAKLLSDPEAVSTLLTTFSPAAALDAGGTGTLASISGTPTSATKAGRYSIASDLLGNVEATFQANDGSAPLVTSGVIAAGGTNSTLIPGVTLTAKGALVAGTDLVTISATQEGFGKTLHEYLNSISRTGGLLSTRSDEMQTRIATLNEQIDTMNARLEAREALLMKKFSAMEQAISRLQGQQQQLVQMTAQLNRSS